MRNRTSFSVLKYVLLVLILSMAAPAAIRISVTPSGNPSSPGDTPAIQTALLACAGATEPCVVDLAAGHYYIEQLAVRDFRGVLRGAGKDRTVLHAIANLKVDPTWGDFYWSKLPAPDYRGPHLVFFVGGDVTVMDLTIRVEDPTPFELFLVAPGMWEETAMFNALTVHADPAAPAAAVNSKILRVGVHGAPGSSFGGAYEVNLANAIHVGALIGFTPLKGGTHVIQECDVSFAVTGIYPFQTDESRILIGGAASQANRLYDVYDGIDIWENSGSRVDVMRNQITALWFGITVDQGIVGMTQASPVRATLSQNSIRMAASTAPREAIMVNDRQLAGGGSKSLIATVEQNTVVLEEGSIGGIDVWNADGALVTNNILRGGALWGIGAMGAVSATILGNNVQGVRAVKAPIYLSGEGTYEAPDGYGGIVLVPYAASRTCAVVGSGNAEVVLDEGIGNTVTGARRK